MMGLNEIRKLNRRACVHCTDDRFSNGCIQSGDDCYKCKALTDQENYGSRWSFANGIAKPEKE